MADDKIMFNGSDVVLLDRNGTDYKAKISSERFFYFGKIFAFVALIATVIFLANAVYNNFDVRPGLCFFSIIGTVVSFILMCIMGCQVGDAYTAWKDAVKNYNRAVADNQDKVFNAIEAMAHHKANLTAIADEKKFDFKANTMTASASN